MVTEIETDEEYRGGADMRTATSAIEGLTTADETVAPKELGSADGGTAETAETTSWVKGTATGDALDVVP